MGPGSDPRPRPVPSPAPESAPAPVPAAVPVLTPASVSVPPSVPVSAPVSTPLPPFPLAQQPVVSSGAATTSTVGSAPPSTRAGSRARSHIAMEAIPSPTSPSSAADSTATAGTTGRATPEPGSASRKSHQTSNPYACRDCGRTYSRPEHLVRHVQTHTLGRRFACEICKKSFARKDLLRRHVANHENDSPKKRQRLLSSPNSSRVTQACRACAAARVKCDESKPCRRCVSRNLPCSSYEASTSGSLVHLPASGPDAADARPSGEWFTASTDSKPASHSSVPSASANFVRDNTASKSSPLSQGTSSRQDESQLATPDTGIEQGTSYR
jgi:uncharacterized Zn-finger protein